MFTIKKSCLTKEPLICLSSPFLYFPSRRLCFQTVWCHCASLRFVTFTWSNAVSATRHLLASSFCVKAQRCKNPVKVSPYIPWVAWPRSLMWQKSNLAYFLSTVPVPNGSGFWQTSVALMGCGMQKLVCCQPTSSQTSPWLATHRRWAGFTHCWGSETRRWSPTTDYAPLPAGRMRLGRQSMGNPTGFRQRNKINAAHWRRSVGATHPN